MSEAINHHRRLLGTAAMTTAAVEFVMIGYADAQSRKTKRVREKNLYQPFMRTILSFLLPGVCAGHGFASAASELPAFKVERWVNSTTGSAPRPYVKAWNRDYAKLGLVVVGVHAPEFEAEIRRLLVAANPGIKLPAVSPEATAFAKTGEPSYAGITGETYVGAERREPGSVTLEGDWQSERQYLELKKASGKIVLSFTAGEVNLVMQPGLSGKAAVTVQLDGKPVGEARGADVGPDGVARFDRSGMIRLVARASRGKHVLTLIATDPGLRAFVFTFGP